VMGNKRRDGKIFF